MVDVTGVRFKSSGKVYYFDPCDFDLKPGQGVIVETARGLEFGIVTMKTTPIKEEDVVHPLKKIVRIADEKDHARHEENEKKKAKAMRICQEKIQKHKLDMKLIDVEYTFDNNKIIFYFTADGRVDFRDLVKDLAGVFKMRIELRQIGVRDEAKMLGGVGSCGRGLCCSTWLADFQPVSIKMAKVQNLSLNPAKISGVCGRLMCCLKYENDVYLDLRKDMPEVNEKVITPDGLGKVIESDVLTGRIKVRLYSGEKDDNGVEKLGSDILTLGKEDVEPTNKKKAEKRAAEARAVAGSFGPVEEPLPKESEADPMAFFAQEDAPKKDGKRTRGAGARKESGARDGNENRGDKAEGTNEKKREKGGGNRRRNRPKNGPKGGNGKDKGDQKQGGPKKPNQPKANPNSNQGEGPKGEEGGKRRPRNRRRRQGGKNAQKN